MRSWLIVAVLVPALGGVAQADRLTEPSELPSALSMSHRLKNKVNLASDGFGGHLRNLSFDVVDLRFDIHKREGKFNLGSEGEEFGLRFESDIYFQQGYARVDATVNLKLGGHDLKLEMPDFDLVPRSVNGERVVEVRLPVFYGRF